MRLADHSPQPSILPDFCYSGKPLTDVGGVVLHYFSAINVAPDRWDEPEACFDLFIDLNLPGPERHLIMPADNTPRYYASAHWLVDRRGHEHLLVPLDKQAYHAGRSELNGRPNLNAWTYGIEFIATHTSGFTDEQYLTGQRLVAQMMSQHGFGLDAVVGHQDVAVPKGRKRDPGPKFDWHRFKGPLTSVI